MKTLIVIVSLCLIPSVGYGAARKPASVPQTTEAVPLQHTINVRVNPLGLLIGALSGDVDFAVTKKFTIGPSISYYSATIFDTSLTGYGLGARANVYLTGDAMTDSWILGPGLGLSINSVSSGESKASSVGFYVGSILGYQWVWTSGLNINLGLGANYYTQSASAKGSDGIEISVPGYHGLGPTGELTVGWAF